MDKGGQEKIFDGREPKRTVFPNKEQATARWLLSVLCFSLFLVFSYAIRYYPPMS